MVFGTGFEGALAAPAATPRTRKAAARAEAQVLSRLIYLTSTGNARMAVSGGHPGRR
jgi:hypothetical protein